MKPYSWIICFLCAFLSAGCVVAPTRVQAQPQVPVVLGEPDPLEELVAPIALYPDALVAIVLPASTAATDIVLAARYLDAGGDPNDVESRAWDDSVKSLVHFPELVQWMNENLEWTEELGSAYLAQPDGVMAAIQRARARAMANGTLVTTPEQQVVVEDGSIRIIPAQATVIYVPRYDPEIIFINQPPDFFPGPLITWGPAFGVGFWLSYDCDWGHRVIWCDPHPREHWHNYRDWRHREWHRPGGNGPGHGGWHQWKPPPDRHPPPHRNFDASHREVRQPAPPPGAPRFDHNRVRGPERPANQPRADPPRRAERPEHRTEPARSVPRRTTPQPPEQRPAPRPDEPRHETAPPPRPDEHRHETVPPRRADEHRGEAEHIAPPASRRGEAPGPRHEEQPNHNDSPQSAPPPTTRRAPTRPERQERPAVVQQPAPVTRPMPNRAEPQPPPPPARAAPVQRAEPAREVNRGRDAPRGAPERGAQPVQHTAPAPQNQSHADQRNNNNDNNDRRPDDRRDARDH
ncbi:MAG TPA: DUF3300 domain-containing protein [Opitutus sp.]|nr:DUF3300 domain-containing protein [Opitutus sp.]